MAWPNSPPSSQANATRGTLTAARSRQGAQGSRLERLLPATNGLQPVPPRFTILGLSAELLGTVSCAMRAPKPSGVNTTSTKQVACGARLNGQLVPEIEYSLRPASGCTNVMPPRAAANAPSLVTITREAGDALPIRRSPKPIVTGLTLTTGFASAITWAVSAMAREPPGASLTMVSVPL